MHYCNERVGAFGLVEPTLDKLTVEILPRALVGCASALELDRPLNVRGVRKAAACSMEKIVDHRIGTTTIDKNLDQAHGNPWLWLGVIDAGSSSPNDLSRDTVDEIVSAAEPSQVICAAKCVDRVQRLRVP